MIRCAKASRMLPLLQLYYATGNKHTKYTKNEKTHSGFMSYCESFHLLSVHKEYAHFGYLV